MDALEFLKQLPDKYADLILTDPPYGIGAAKGVGISGKAESRKYDDTWDSKPPTQEVFDELLRVGKKVIIFGGNYFAHNLPISKNWIVWDKQGSHDWKAFLEFQNFELAWTNVKGTKKYTVIQHGFISEEKARLHPTQKPVVLFEAIIQDHTKPEEIVIDPFIGSGTTAVAAKKLKRNFIGCDNLQKYVDITNRRLENPWL